MNLSPARIVIIVVLALGGILALANGFPDGTSSATPSPSPEVSVDPDQTVTPDVTPSETPDAGGGGAATDPAEVPYQVLNGTNTSGLAASVQVLLSDAGYTNPAAEAADWTIKPLASTFVYFRAGEDQAERKQNRADARAIAAVLTELGGINPDVQELDDEQQDPPSLLATVVIIVGGDFAMGGTSATTQTPDAAVTTPAAAITTTP